MTITDLQRNRGPWWARALAGILAATVGISVATAVAALISGVPSPVVSVGNETIDRVPPFVKDFAINTFGTHDKTVLVGGMLIVLAIIAAFAGIVARRSVPASYIIVALIGLVGVAAAAVDRTATASRGVALVPSIVALAASLVMFRVLLHSLEDVPEGPHRDATGPDRRSFITAAIAAGIVVAVGGAIGKAFSTAAATASRAALRIPPPTEPVSPIPAGTALKLKGIFPYITSNKDFYRVDTALRTPDVSAEDWTLRVHGMVDNELELSMDDIMAMPLMERRITLTCVSNPVGGPLVGNATWIGVPVRSILERAAAQTGADAVKSTSDDGWTAGTPLSALTDDRNALLAVAMNGEPLPLVHGFPARMVVPGLYGYVSATKWLTELEVTRFQDFQAYWTPRGYSAKGPIKLSSRIDVPKSGDTFPSDAVRVGGVAWAQNIGIERVEVKVDDGRWNDARLGAEDGIDTWRQWSWQWDDAKSGRHILTVRATDETGHTQTSAQTGVLPDGPTGWDSIEFIVV